MPTLPQTEPASRPKTKNKPLTSFPADEMADFQGCTAEEIGLLMQLRWHAWYHQGIENTEENLFRLRKTFGVSAQKFRKKLSFLLKFFTEIDGFLFYTADERRRSSSEEITAKQQEAGRKRAEQMWGARGNVPKSDDSSAIASIPTTPIQSKLPITAAAEETSSVVAMAEAVENDVAAENKPHARKPPEREQSTGFPEAQKLIASCGRFADVTPDFVEKLANAARDVLPELDDGTLCDAIRATFKREKQLSAGLWLHTVPAWLRNRKVAATA